MSEELQPGLWACHVRGPNDVLAALDELDAHRMANKINTKHGGARENENDPIICAIVIPWPWSADDHAKSLTAQKK